MEPPRKILLRNRDGEVVAEVLVDAADYEWLSQRRWCRQSMGYAARTKKRNGKSQAILMHRQIMGLVAGDGIEVDHINHDKLDNRRRNLRIVNRQWQCQNTSAQRTSTSRFRGVYWFSRVEKWVATVKIDGQRHHLGYFTDEEEAARAAAEFRLEHMPGATA